MMSYVISGFCDMCDICVGVCPVGAIKEGDIQYEIDPFSCVGCGKCVKCCPLGSITEE